MVAKTKKTNAKTKDSIQKKSSSNAALAPNAAALKKKKNTKNTKKKSTKPKEEKPNSSKFGMHRAGGTNAKNTSSSAFERSVANFPKFDPEAGSSVYGVSSLSHKDHKRWTLDLRSDWRFFHSFTWFPSS